MSLIRPHGIVVRMVRPNSIPGKTRSSTYFARPVALPIPSLRGTLVPTEDIARPFHTEKSETALKGQDTAIALMIWRERRSHPQQIKSLYSALSALFRPFPCEKVCGPGGRVHACPTPAPGALSSMQTVRNFVGGEWLTPTASNWYDLTNPATGDALGRVPMCGTTE